MREAMVSTALIVLAIVTLGTDWTGVEVRPGEWRDRVTAGQWAVFLTTLTAVGVVTARLIRPWSRRTLMIAPVLLWLLWQLRAGTLWPIAFALYGTGIVVAWLTGLAVGGWTGQRRSRGHSPG